MKIDVHAHYWTEDYLDRLVELGKSDTANHRGIGAGPDEELDDRLRLMDRSGVQMQVLSAAPQLPYGLDRDRAVAAARSVNDQYTALVERYPDRFRAFAATPMPHIEASVLEIIRALDEMAMVGVAMNTTVLDRALRYAVMGPVSCAARRWSRSEVHSVTDCGWIAMVDDTVG